MVWRMIKSFVPMLDRDFRKMYNLLKLGKEEEESRVDVCFSYANKILSNLVGALFLKKQFSANAKSDVRTSLVAFSFVDRVLDKNYNSR